MPTNKLEQVTNIIREELSMNFLNWIEEGIDISMITLTTDVKPPHRYSVDGVRKKTYMNVTFTLGYLHNGQPKKVIHTVEKNEEDRIHGELVAMNLRKMVEKEL